MDLKETSKEAVFTEENLDFSVVDIEWMDSMNIKTTDKDGVIDKTLNLIDWKNIKSFSGNDTLMGSVLNALRLSYVERDIEGRLSVKETTGIVNVKTVYDYMDDGTYTATAYLTRMKSDGFKSSIRLHRADHTLITYTRFCDPTKANKGAFKILKGGDVQSIKINNGSGVTYETLYDNLVPKLVTTYTSKTHNIKNIRRVQDNDAVWTLVIDHYDNGLVRQIITESPETSRSPKFHVELFEYEYENGFVKGKLSKQGYANTEADATKMAHASLWNVDLRIAYKDK